MWIRKKIRVLTGRQQALLAVVREDWLRVGLALRTDWQAVQRIVPAVYLAAGRKPLDSIIALDSPRAGLHSATATAAASKSEPYDMRAEAGKQIRRHVLGKVRAQVRDQAWAHVQDVVEEQIRRQLTDEVRAELGEEFPPLLGVIWSASHGLQDAASLAFYDFFARIGLDAVPLLAALVDLARAGAGWWWPFGKVAIISSAPCLLNRDTENRLHCENGPALAYPDGWAIWAIHGVRVAAKVITAPLSLNVKEIMHEPNPAVRRVMLERFGYEHFVQEAGLEPVQADRFGRLYRLESEYGTEPTALVEVANTTPERDGSHRRYFLCVPPTARTAHEAVAWTFGLSPREYQPSVES